MHGSSIRPVPYGQGFPSIKVRTWAQLQKELKGSTATGLALASADIQAGRLIVTPMPARWANRMTGANQSAAKAIRELSARDRVALRDGQLHLALHQRKISDAKLDQLVSKIGADRVLESLDRLTQPVSSADRATHFRVAVG